MEINKVSTPNVVGVELKKQPQKINDIGLKEDTFQKAQTPFDIDVAMKSLDEIKDKDGNKKFYLEFVTDEIKKELIKDPHKWPYVSEMGNLENVSQFHVQEIIKQPVDNIKTFVSLIKTKDRFGKDLKFPTKGDVSKILELDPVQMNNAKALANTEFTTDGIVSAAKEENVNFKKLAKNANELTDVLPKIKIHDLIFEKDSYSKGDYTLTLRKNDMSTVKVLLDDKTDRYAIETSNKYRTNNKTYEIKKVSDYRNNTTAKTRYEESSLGYPIVTHEVRLVKDKNGKLQRTEYTEPSQIKGVYDIKHVMPDGTEKIISSGKIDKKTGISSIKKDMTSALGTRTQYLYEDDPQGNRILDYKITDKNGKVLLNNSESFEVVSENKFISSKNNRSYEITADKDSVTVKDLQNPDRVAIFKNDIDIEGDKNEIISVLKQMPGEELFKLKNSTNKLVGIKDVLSSYSSTQLNQRSIVSGNNLFIVLHELGHACDVNTVDLNDEESAINAIFNNEEFNTIYEKEKAAFNKAFPDAQRDHIQYFIDHETHYNGEVGGLRETIAESNALLTTAKSHEILGIRSQYLQQYFPETIAFLDKRLAEVPSKPIKYEAQQ